MSTKVGYLALEFLCGGGKGGMGNPMWLLRCVSLFHDTKFSTELDEGDE